MTKGVSVVAALAASMFLDAVGTAKAQSLYPDPEEVPDIYTWDAPSGGWPTGLQPHVSQMVREYVNIGPGYSQQQAINAADAIETAATLQIAAGTTSSSRVCILLQHFGSWVGKDQSSPHDHQLSFIDETDAVDVVWFNNQQPFNYRYLQSLQPWCVVGRGKVKAWMEWFLEAYDGPTPQRFHFDTEEFFWPFFDGSENAIRILEAVYNDDRWDTVPVPGSKDYLVPSAGDKTMALMYEEAQARFTWPDVPLIHPGAVKRDEPPDSDANRKYYIWYREVCKRAFDASMEECAYSLIKDKWPNCKVSNYEHMTVDGKVDTFGWYTGIPDTGQPVNSNLPPPLQPMRTSVRGMTNFFDEGWTHWWSDFIEKDPATQSVIRPSVWTVYASATKADFSSPFLYPPTWLQYNHPTSIRYNYYLPPPQDLTAISATLQNARREVESIINTPGGSPSKVVPWVSAPGTEWWDGAYIWTADDLRDVLAMLRAKKTEEIIIWWPDETLYPYWPDFLDTLDGVYKPQLNLIRVLTGTCTNCPPYPTAIPVDRLRYTLRENDASQAEYVQVDASGTDPQQAVIRLLFDGMSYTLGNKVVLNLECSITSSLQNDLADVRGQIYAWDGTTWRLLPIDDYPNDPDNGFGFFAPVNPDAPNAGWTETRRTWECLDKFVVNGKMEIKIVLQRTASTAPFTARFDLVQLVDQDFTEAPAESMAQGADHDHSQMVESYDVASFMTAYAAGAEAADFNNDGVVNADDLTAFNAAFVAGPP